MGLETHFKGGKVSVWKETFAILKAKKPVQGALALIQDKKEITVIIDKTKISPENILEIKEGWKAITLEISSPFELVGFLGMLGSAMAEEGVSVCVVPSYSTDHVLVRETDLEKALRKFKKLGCGIRYD